MKNTWVIGFLFLLLGCTTSPCPTTRPTPHSSCSPPADGSTCSYPMPDGTTHSCFCNGATWSCNTCDFAFGYPPTVIFDCSTQRTEGCEMETSEWQISCSCVQPEKQAICCGSESLDRYYNCQQDRQVDGGLCCADCPGIPTGTGMKRCTCGPDHRFRCVIT